MVVEVTHYVVESGSNLLCVDGVEIHLASNRIAFSFVCGTCPIEDTARLVSLEEERASTI